MKTYFIEKYIEENDDIYVDSSLNISDIYKKKRLSLFFPDFIFCNKFRCL